jgi:hypothetical protein
MRSARWITTGILAAFPSVLGRAQSADSTSVIRGFAAGDARVEHAVEAKMAALLNRDSTGAFFRVFTAKPHPAGTVRNKELADYVADHFRAYGWDSVALHRYDVYLPWPESVSVTMTAPVRYEAALKEDPYPQDSDS